MINVNHVLIDFIWIKILALNRSILIIVKLMIDLESINVVSVSKVILKSNTKIFAEIFHTFLTVNNMILILLIA